MLTLAATMGSAPVRERPPRDIQTRSKLDGLDGARGVLFSVLMGLAGWIAIGTLIAVCASR